MTIHSTSREARNEAENIKAAFRSIVTLANMPDDAKAELLLNAEECVDEAFHDEIADLEHDEEARASCIYHSELAADIRDLQRRAF
jgi:hypothetical protein